MSVRTVNRHKESYDEYLGYPHKLSNPYLNSNLPRLEKILKYRDWLWTNIYFGEITKEYLRSLDNKRLGCSCHPLPCHVDIVCHAVDWACGRANPFIAQQP